MIRTWRESGIFRSHEGFLSYREKLKIQGSCYLSKLSFNFVFIRRRPNFRIPKGNSDHPLLKPSTKVATSHSQTDYIET